MNVQIDQLALAVQKEFGIYSSDVTEIVKRQCDIEANAAVQELRRTSPKRTGKYAKSWARKTEYENTRTKRNTVYNKKFYQLTHLLENGHDLKRKNVKFGAVPAYSHIKAVEDNVMERLEAKIKEAIRG